MSGASQRNGPGTLDGRARTEMIFGDRKVVTPPARPATPRDLISTAEAAREIEVSPETLGRWRRKGFGPPFMALGPTGRTKKYSRAEVRAWLARQLRSPRVPE